MTQAIFLALVAAFQSSSYNHLVFTLRNAYGYADEVHVDIVRDSTIGGYDYIAHVDTEHVFTDTLRAMAPIIRHNHTARSLDAIVRDLQESVRFADAHYLASPLYLAGVSMY